MFTAVHADIGVSVYPHLSPAALVQMRVFFYSHSYVVPTSVDGFGKLEPIPHHSLLSLEWPQPDLWSIASLKQKMVLDIHNSLKYTRASRSVGLSWCFPSHCFAYIFKELPFVETCTMFVCKDVHYKMLGCLLDETWGIVEGMHNADRYRCQVGEYGIGMRYLKSRMTLYMRFHYDRWMCKLGVWVPLQSVDANITPFEITVSMVNDVLETIQVSKHWTLSNVREHLNIMGFEDMEGAQFRIQGHKVQSFVFGNIFAQFK